MFFGFYLTPVTPFDLLSPTWWRLDAAAAMEACWLPALAGVAVAWIYFRGMWRLPAHWSPARKIILAVVATLMLLAGTAYLRWSAIQDWPYELGLKPFIAAAVFAGAAICWWTERTNQMRVYVGLWQIIYLPRAQINITWPVGVILGLVSVSVAWQAISRFYDEPLDAGLEAFYAPDPQPVPDNQNAMIALAGISAPRGADIIQYGRMLTDSAQINASAKARAFVRSPDELKLTVKASVVDCWIWDLKPGEDHDCVNADQLRAILADNAELLARYRAAIALPEIRFSPIGKGGDRFIGINKLIAAEIELDLREGRAEIAYQKWRENFAFLGRVMSAEATTVEKLIWMVIEGMQRLMAEEMLFRAPQLRQAHAEELRQLFAASGIERWNVRGMLRAQGEPTVQITLHGMKNWMHPNYLRNRQYRVAQAILAELQSHDPDVIDRLDTIARDYINADAPALDYLLHPENPQFSKSNLEGEARIGLIAKTWISKSGMMRLLALNVMLAEGHVGDGDIDAFLRNAAPALRNPYSGEPMHWHAANRVLYFCRPKHPDEMEQVRLPGGKFIRDEENACKTVGPK